MNRHQVAIHRQEKRYDILIGEGFTPDKAEELSQKQIMKGELYCMRKIRMEAIDFIVEQGWSRDKAINLVNGLVLESK